jgi:L-ascorbate metabolism protein UlaG (beta-lactamase superfamily)
LLASLAARDLHRSDMDVQVRDLLAELAPHGMALVWLGHASVVATLGALTLVVDPVLSRRIGPRIFGRTWGLARRGPSPVGSSSLVGMDLVLLTHAHFDHLDRPTLERLADARTSVVAARGCGSLVPKGYRAVHELGAGESIELHGAVIEAVEARHWGARMVVDRKRASVGYVVRHAEGSVLFAGDTAFTKSFDRVAPIDVAAFGIGAYNPWEHMHATPEQVWRMFLSLGARFLLPIHHSTFELSDEPLDEPTRRLLDAAGDSGDRILTGVAGEIMVVTKPSMGATGGGPEGMAGKA